MSVLRWLVLAPVIAIIIASVVLLVESLHEACDQRGPVVRHGWRRRRLRCCLPPDHATAPGWVSPLHVDAEGEPW